MPLQPPAVGRTGEPDGESACPHVQQRLQLAWEGLRLADRRRGARPAGSVRRREAAHSSVRQRHPDERGGRLGRLLQLATVREAQKVGAERARRYPPSVTSTGRIRRAEPSQRLTRFGLALLALAAIAWATTYGPPGTLTSIALGALAAYVLAFVGSVVLTTALVLRLRR